MHAVRLNGAMQPCSLSSLQSEALTNWPRGHEPFLRSRAASRLATQEFHNILWKPNVHCRVCKTPPLAPVLRLMQSITPHTVGIEIHFYILGLPSGLFPSGFPTNIQCSSIFSIRATCPVYLILVDLIILSVFGEKTETLGNEN
jgi:hypothetical protein